MLALVNLYSVLQQIHNSYHSSTNMLSKVNLKHHPMLLKISASKVSRTCIKFSNQHTAQFGGPVPIIQLHGNSSDGHL